MFFNFKIEDFREDVFNKVRVRVQNRNKNHPWLENLSPLPKNPMIAKVFREIGFAEELGSGTRNLFKYVPIYSGVSARPHLIYGKGIGL